MKCFECGQTDALLLFSSVLCANYKCSLYDRKHAEEISPAGLPNHGADGVQGATHIQGASTIFGLQGASGIV